MNYLIKNIWVLLLLLTSSLSAQELEVSYEVLPQAADKHLVRVYVQSTSEQPLDLRAVNFSFAFEGKCAALETFESIFDQSWTRHLVENQQYGELDLHYDQAWYSTRLQYGNADPGLPATAQLTAPAKGEAPLQVMELTFTGSCAQHVYLEHVSQNPLNQIADQEISPINYVIVHPKSHTATAVEQSLAEGLTITAFPNPTEGPVTLSFGGKIPAGEYQFQLIDNNGKTLKRIKHVLSEELTMDLTPYPQGIYHLEISATKDPKSMGSIGLIKK